MAALSAMAALGLLAFAAVGAGGFSHGSGRWAPERRPALSAADGPLGWRLEMATGRTRHFLEALRRLVAAPLHEANKWLNEEGGKACVFSGCALALGRGACQKQRIWEVLSHAKETLARAQDVLQRDFQQAVQRLGVTWRSVGLGLGEPAETARQALEEAMWQLQGLELELRTLAAEDGTACFPGLAMVLNANVHLSRIGLEKTSQLDHQLTLEALEALDTELKLPRAVRHRSDLGYHHTDIVASLLSELLHKVRRSDKGRKELAAIEVGTASAECTVRLLQAVPQARVITIDPWQDPNSSGAGEGRQPKHTKPPPPAESAAAVARKARQALEPYADRVSIFQMRAEEAAKLLADRAFDLVFIDSGTDRERDVEAFLPKVRPGGILCGHDFFKTAAYTRAVLASVPAGQALYVGPDWMWWFEL